MSALLAFVPWWGRALAIVALIAAVAGWGYVKGVNAELARHEATERKAAQVREESLHRALEHGAKAAREYAQYRTQAEEKQRDLAEQIRRAPKRALYHVACADRPAAPDRGLPARPDTQTAMHTQTPAAPAADDPPDVRVTWEFVGLWDAPGGAGAVPADPGGAAHAPGDLSPFGPRDLLANHTDNAAACELDRERQRRLIAFIRSNLQKETQR